MSCLRGVIFLGNGTTTSMTSSCFWLSFFVPAPDGGVMEALWYRSLLFHLLCLAVLLFSVPFFLLSLVPLWIP